MEDGHTGSALSEHSGASRPSGQAVTKQSSEIPQEAGGKGNDRSHPGDKGKGCSVLSGGHSRSVSPGHFLPSLFSLQFGT